MSKTFIELLDDIQELHEQLADKIFNEVVCAKKQEWLPCSDVLPSDRIEVLACLEDGWIEIASYSHVRKAWYVKGKWIKKVIAWQPLPKPYEVEEDKEI